MQSKSLLHALAGAAAALTLVLTLGAATQDAQPGGDEMAQAMAKAAKLTGTNENHKFLERMLGTWDYELQFTMAGMSGMPPEKGTTEAKWLVEGRWLQAESTGTMMGMPMKSFTTIGYDNFKQSYRVSMLNSVDTAMLISEGDLTQKKDVLITYGTLDEYLTGEHDKMVKYLWRFLSDDEILLEVHDLPIGEENTKVFQIRSKRRK